MKRQRGRGRKPGNPTNRSYESNGPDVKIRGNANQIYEKYLQYARDAQTSGNRVASEAYFQHAEHYFRIIAASTPKDKMPQFHDEQDDHYEDRQAHDESDSKSYDQDQDDDEEDAATEVDSLRVVDGDAEAPEQIRSSEDGEKRTNPRYRGRRPRARGNTTPSAPSQKAEAVHTDHSDDAGLRAMMARTSAPEVTTEPAAD